MKAYHAINMKSMNELKLLKPTNYEKHEWIKTIKTNCFSVSSFVLYPCHEICIVWMLCALYCYNVLRSVLFQCRERGSSYLGSLSISMLWKVNGRIQGTVERKIADVPIMVKVRLCHVMYKVHKQVLYTLYIYLVHYSLLYMHTRYKFEVFGYTTLCFYNIDFIILDF